jgi:hypothetical protein
MVIEDGRLPLGATVGFSVVFMVLLPLTVMDAVTTGGLVRLAAVVGVAAGLTAGVLGIALHRRVEFMFDRPRRVLAWKREGFFAEREGQVPFDEILEVKVEINRLSEDAASKGMLFVATKAGVLVLSSFQAPTEQLDAVAAAVRGVLASRPDRGA